MAEILNFDEGVKEYEINGDPNRKLKVNMADIGIIDRMQSALEKMQAEFKNLNIDLNSDGESSNKEEKVVAYVRELNKKLRDSIDEIFYAGASDAIFWIQNPLSTASNGATIYENFIEAFTKILEPELKKAQKKSEKHIQKYQQQLDKASAFKNVQ